ncbi:MAG: M23 family metallopeptidase [Proteobacteria bacterium]|nr:M23 family metallopeptidase [Pseudomonadota bacterium]
MANKIPKSMFSKWLIDMNNLKADSFHQWIFYPGMLFGSMDTWWGKTGNRSGPHEGLDICYYEDLKGKMHRIGPTTKIAAMYHGIVYNISDDDFIGQSIYVIHPQFKNCSGDTLCTVYAHARAYEGILEGTAIHVSDIIAEVADFRKAGSSMTDHLHLSMAYLPAQISKTNMNWKTMANPDMVTLLNPLDYIECRYNLKAYRK